MSKRWSSPSPPTEDPSLRVDPCPTHERIPLSEAVTKITETKAHAISHQLEIDQGERFPDLKRLARLKSRR